MNARFHPHSRDVQGASCFLCSVDSLRKNTTWDWKKMKLMSLIAASALALVTIVTVGAATAPSALAAKKCKSGDRIYTHRNAIYCISRTKRPKCPRARYRVDYRRNKDMCVRYRANGSVKKVFEPKCGFLGTGPGRLMTRGVDKCAYNPSVFHK